MNPTPTKDEMERMGPTELAALCGKVAESPTASSLEADQSREMKAEWEKLAYSVNMPQEEYKRKKELLMRKTASFLVATCGIKLA